MQVAAATDGQATVLTVGLGRLRRAAALRARRRLPPPRSWSRPTRWRSARPTSPTRSPQVVRDHEAAGRATTWCCSATTPPTPVTSRSASGWPTSSAGPVVTGRARRVEVDGDTVVGCRGDGPDGGRRYEVPLPAVVTRDGGRRRAALPDDHRPDEGQEGARSRPAPLAREPAGSGRVRLTLPPPAPTNVEVLGEGPGGRRRPWSTCCRSWGWRDDPRLRGDRGRGRRGGLARDGHLRPRPVRRRRRRPDRRGRGGSRARRRRRPSSAAYGVRNVHHADADDFDLFSGAATAGGRDRGPAGAGLGRS